MSRLMILFADAPRIHVPSGAHVFRRDDPVRAAHLVVEGAVALTRALADGGAVKLHCAVDGELLAEASLFSAVHHCDGVAARDTTLAALPIAAMRARLDGDPTLYTALVEDFAQELQRLRTRVEILRLKRLADRLDAWLATNRPPEHGGWIRVAEDIGVTPAALYRELAKRR